MDAHKLQSITLKNFMGITAEHHLDGANVNVYGANQIGKTRTFAHAIAYVFTGKTFEEHGDAQILPINSDAVEATVRIDFGDMQLTRGTRLKMTRKRGETEATPSGEEGIYEINDVDVPQSVFFEKLGEIAPFALIPLITNTSAVFTTDWRELRATLFDTFGGITPEQVAERHADLAPAVPLIAKHGDVDTALTAVKAARSKAQKTLSEAGPRLDSALEQLDRVVIPPAPSSEELGAALQVERDAEAALEAAQVGAVDAGLVRRRDEVREAISAAREEARAANAERREAFDAEQHQLRKAVDEAVAASDAARLAAREAADAVDAKKREIDALRATVAEASNKHAALLSTKPALEAKTLTGNVAALVAAAEPFLTDEALANDARIPALQSAVDGVKFGGDEDELLAALNRERAAELATLEATVNEGNERGAALSDELRELEAARDAAAERVATEVQREEAAREKLNALAAPEPTVADTAALEAELTTIEETLNTPSGDIAALRAALTDAKHAVATLRTAEAAHTNATTNQAALQEGVEQVKQSKEAAAKLLAAAERDLIALETLVRRQAEMASENINAQFANIQFELFFEQKNGGIRAVCNPTNRAGVRYAGLSTSERVRLGLDFVATMQRALGVELPIVVDSRESVTHLPNVSNQLINLIVSPSDAVIRVEKEQ